MSPAEEPGGGLPVSPGASRPDHITAEPEGCDSLQGVTSTM